MSENRTIRQELVRITADEYHADPVPPSLSATIAHVLVKQSPAHAYTRHPRLGGVPREPTRSFDRGTLSHRLLLDAGKDVVVVEVDDWRTADAQRARAAALSVGKIPVLVGDYEEALGAATILRGRFADLGIALEGQSEVTALWGEQTFDGDMVQCRGMLDHVAMPRVYDLKSCRSAHPDACQRHIDDYGYAIQRAAYVSALEKLYPKHAGRIDFVFVFFELEPPYAVTPIRLNGEFRELGKRRWRRAVESWAGCLRTNQWPGYATEIIEIEPPHWALAKDRDQQVAAAAATCWRKDL